MSVRSRVGRWANETNSSLYRRFDSSMFRRAAGMPLLLLTVAGRKSGTPYTNPVSYFMEGSDYVVCGSGGGSKEDPQWFKNLRHADRAHVEVREEEFDVAVRIVSDPAERDRLLARLVEVGPRFGGYERKIERKGGTRKLPLAVLTRVA